MEKKALSLQILLPGLILVLGMLYMLLPFIDVFFYAIFIYYVTRPIYEKMSRKFKNENIASLVSLFLIVLPFVLILIYTLFVASIELMQLASSVQYTSESGETMTYMERLQTVLTNLEPSDIPLILKYRNLTAVLTGVINASLGLAFNLFLMFSLTYFFLRDGSKLKKWIIEQFLSVGREDEESLKPLVNKFFDDVDKGLFQVFQGGMLNAVYTGLLAIITFMALNIIAPNQSTQIPYPVLIGVLCGASSLVPIVGIKLVWVPLTAYIAGSAYYGGVLFQSLWYVVLFVLVANLVIDLIPDLVLRPLVSGKNLHTGALMFTYIFGPAVFGLSGLFIGPILLVSTTHYIKIFTPKVWITKKEDKKKK